MMPKATAFSAFLVAAASVVSWGEAPRAQSTPPVALTGVVTSAADGALEGVLVSARNPRRRLRPGKPHNGDRRRASADDRRHESSQGSGYCGAVVERRVDCE